MFLTQDFDDNLFLYHWLWCDFPIKENQNIVLVDTFTELLLTTESFSEEESKDLVDFHQRLKASRLGLYQANLSTDTITTYDASHGERSEGEYSEIGADFYRA